LPQHSPINAKPKFLNIKDAITYTDTLFSSKVSFSDDNIGDKLQIKTINAPKWLSLLVNKDLSAQLKGIPAYEDAGNYAVILELSDGTDKITDTLQIKVISLNAPPVFTSSPILKVKANNLYSYSITATDADNTSLILKILKKPTWLEFKNMEKGTALLTGIPAKKDTIDNNIILMATDGIDTTYQRFIIKVDFTDEIPDEILSFSNPEVFPNPAGEFVCFSFNQPVKNNPLIQCFNLFGKELRISGISNVGSKNKNVIIISTQDFESGIYLFKITIDHKVFFSKIVIEN
jgi:preprotein translocase subunit Sss1